MARSRRDDDGLAGWALILAFIIAIFFLISSRTEARQGVATPRLANEVISPLAALMSKPVRSAEKFIFGFKDRARAHEENIVLRQELAEMREKYARLEAVEVKLRGYEAILGSRSQTVIPLEKIAARAVSESNGPFVQSQLLNVGARHGVQIGNPVISPNGLVGHIIMVGPSSSRALGLQDLNSRIAVMSKSGQMRAIMSGDNSMNPRLNFVQNESKWQAGMEIVTSGDDGMLPQGLTVGTVQRDQKGNLQVALTSSAAPVDWVWVSPYVRVVPPEPTVTSVIAEVGEVADLVEDGEP